MRGRISSFYPRHPRGWRQKRYYEFQAPDNVSIHATLAGGDRHVLDVWQPGIQFLSTPPSRVATAALRGKFEKMAFLSTPPSRVATRHTAVSRKKGEVSIHATLAGGDARRCDIQQGADGFLSTPPSRVATECVCGRNGTHQSFYPRHPRGWRQVMG